MDAGPGTFAELQKHTDPARLTAVWISHLHADPLSAVYGLAYGGLTRPCPYRCTPRQSERSVSSGSSGGPPSAS